jgi:putative ABC transport system ATP-binding protein
MSAFENVMLPMTINGKLSKKEASRKAVELLSLVGLEDRLEHIVFFYAI